MHQDHILSLPNYQIDRVALPSPAPEPIGSTRYNPFSDKCVEFRQFRDYLGYCVGSDGSFWTRKKRFTWDLADQWRRICIREDARGYGMVGITSGKNSTKPFKVHHLVLECFVGPRPDGYETCHFPDYNRRNNWIGNLRWDTRKSNVHDTKIHGRENKAKGMRSASAKLTDENIREIFRLRKQGYTMQSIADIFGVADSGICRILQRKIWSHLVIDDADEADTRRVLGD